MGGAPYKSAKKGVGTLSSVSKFNHKKAPTSCLQQVDAPKANNLTIVDNEATTSFKVKF